MQSLGPENIWLVAACGGCAYISNVLYSVGGTEMSFGGKKWIRRYLASFILALSANLTAVMLSVWDWKLLIMYPLLSAGMSLGYGGDTVGVKVAKRAVFALGVLSACFVGVWYCGFVVQAWWVFSLAVITGLTSIVLGVVNPFKNAPAEQMIICQVLTMYIPFWAFVK